MAQTCPKCGLLNPPDVRRCDCGYDFIAKPTLVPTPTDLSTLFFSFDGRIPRSTYLLKFFVPYLAAYVVSLVVDHIAGTMSKGGEIGLFSGLFTILALYPSVAAGVKRCHDRDRSGWFLLAAVVPLVNLWVLVELCALRGTIGGNRYGMDPLANA